MTPRKYVDRDDALVALARGRRVLHLGCVGHTDIAQVDRIRLATDTLHSRLSSVSDVIGIDYSAETLRVLQNDGLFTNAIAGNVERLEEVSISGPFDLIVAGDIIEHLSNPGLMLEGAKRFCTPQTTLAISTPNAFGLPGFVRYFLGGFREGDEHVMSFNRFNLDNLLVRHGYEVFELSTCHQGNAETIMSKPLFTVGKRVFQSMPKLGGTLLALARLASG